MTELAVLVPVLRRPHRVAPFLSSLRLTVPDARVVFLCDDTDESMIREVVKAEGVDVVLTRDCNYAEKINIGVRWTVEPLLLFAADDLAFHQGWLAAAKRRLSDQIRVVATNDLCQRRVMAGELATHPLVARDYAEAETIDGSPGPLYEGYPHEYVDREFSEVARARKAFAFAEDSIVEHLHPLVGKAPEDELYLQSRFRMRNGRRIYARRRKLWISRLQ